MDVAHSQPLDFRVSLYSGGSMITGRIAPAHWWYDVTQAARRAEDEQASQQGRSWGKRPPAPTETRVPLQASTVCHCIASPSRKSGEAWSRPPRV